MLTRRKIMLNMIDAMGPSSSLRIQKMMFLFCIHPDNRQQPPYSFFPNSRGPYSFALSDDYHAMLSKGMLERDSESRYRIILDFIPEDISISHESRVLMDRMVRIFAGYDDGRLTRYTYEKAPEFALRSQIIEDLKLSSTFHERLGRERESVRSAEHALYTIGYEGRSIDAFLDVLIRSNVKTVLDVRKNAFSMRPEFCKGYLSKALNEAGIGYEHCPAVGIETGKRNELLPSGHRTELFEWYRENVLPGCEEFAAKVSEMQRQGNVALMCFEKDAHDCHRSHLASFCLDSEPSVGMIRNL